MFEYYRRCLIAEGAISEFEPPPSGPTTTPFLPGDSDVNQSGTFDDYFYRGDMPRSVGGGARFSAANAALRELEEDKVLEEQLDYARMVATRREMEHAMLQVRSRVKSSMKKCWT